MKLFIQNRRIEQFSTDILNKFGDQIRVLIQSGDTAEIRNIDPFWVNRDKLFRQDIFRDGDLAYWFECEPDDLVCFFGHFPAGDLRPAAKGTIIAGDGSRFQKFPPGADGQVIIYDSSAPLGLRAGPGGGGSGQDSLIFGAGSVMASTRTRYLYAGYSDRQAELTPVQVASPRTGTVQRLYVFHNVLGGGANPITYRVRVNNVATLINVVLAANAFSGADTTNTAPVTAGQPIDIVVTKAVTLGASPDNIVAIVEVI